MFFYNENIKRLSVGFIGAVCAHSIAFFMLGTPSLKAVVSAQTYSAPTTVTVRFVSPQKIETPIVEPAKPISTPPPPKLKPVEPKTSTQKTITKKSVKKPVKKQVKKTLPKKLNKIEPASQPIQKVKAPPVQKTAKRTKPDPNIIPVTTEIKTTGRRVQPVYPKSALRRGQEGTVLIRVLISENGHREDIQIHKPSRYALLNTAAIKAVKKWNFDPHIVNGHAAKSWVEIPIEFKIQ